MTRIEDRLREAAEDVRQQVADHAEVEAALAAVTARPARRRPYLLATAAAVVVAVLAGAAVFAAMRDRDDRDVVADGTTTTTTAPASTTTSTTDPTGEGNVAFEVIVDEATGIVPGTLTYAGTADAYADQWRLGAMAGEPPEVDFDERMVLSFTRPDCGEELVGLELEGDRLSALLRGGGTCSTEADPRTIALAVDRSALPSVVHFVVPATPDGSQVERSLVVDVTSAARVSYPPTQGELPLPPEGLDLAAPEPGREIGFDRVGDLRLGDRLDPAEVDRFEETSCGYWGASEPSHDSDEPLSGLVSDADTGDPVRLDIRVGRNTTYRTPSGVGVGTTLATLQRIYGEDLVVDRADGWDRPTDGLLAWYSDVAAVRYGDHALTFALQRDVVASVKVSSAEFWGDDEGCA